MANIDSQLPYQDPVTISRTLDAEQTVGYDGNNVLRERMLITGVDSTISARVMSTDPSVNDQGLVVRDAISTILAANTAPILTRTLGGGVTDSNTLRVVQALDAISSVALFFNDGTPVSRSGGNILVNVQNFATGTFGNSDGNAANLTSAVMFDYMQAYNGTTWDRLHTNAGDSAGALRVTPATDAVSSVVVNSGTLTGVTNSLQVALVDSSGVQYSGSNPVPTTASLSATQNSGPVDATTLRVVHAVDVGTSVNIIGGSIANTGFNITGQDEGNGPSGTQTLRVMIATDAISSVSGSPVAGKNETTNDVLRVIQMTDAVTSANVVTFNGNAPSVGLNETQNGVLRTVMMSDTINSTQSHALAMTTNPAAAADAATVFTKADKLGRLLNTPVQVRQLRATAFATLGGATGSNTETTLIAGVASTFLDLIYVTFANTSTVAASIDIRQGTGGSVIGNVIVPASSTQGFSLSVPVPMTELAQAWTIKFNSTDMGSDLSNTKVYATGLFSQEI